MWFVVLVFFSPLLSGLDKTEIFLNNTTFRVSYSVAKKWIVWKKITAHIIIGPRALIKFYKGLSWHNLHRECWFSSNSHPALQAFTRLTSTWTMDEYSLWVWWSIFVLLGSFKKNKKLWQTQRWHIFCFVKTFFYISKCLWCHPITFPVPSVEKTALHHGFYMIPYCRQKVLNHCCCKKTKSDHST